MATTRMNLSTVAGTEVLFFDLAELDELHHVQRRVCEAKRHPHNPILAQRDINNWDCGWVAPWAMRTVMYDEEEKIFKCWYNGGGLGPGRPGGTGYAVSQDGVHWERPVIGIHDLGDNKQNNVVIRQGDACIIKQKREKDPAKRYWMQANGVRWYSPDGIHWSEMLRVKMKFPEPRAWDPVVLLEDEMDPNPARRYKYVWQAYVDANKPGPSPVRAKYIAFSSDGDHWRPSRFNPILSPNDSFEQENHFLMLAPYKGHYVMLYECGWYHPDGTSRFGMYTADIRLAHSRDCEHFTRLNYDQVTIPCGDYGDWDGGFIVITDKIVVKDDTIYLYYCGLGSEWTSWPPTNVVPGSRYVTKENPYGNVTGLRMRRMGLATLRLDGFTCMEVPDAKSIGHFVTKPMAHQPRRGARLTVNLSDTQERRSWLQVEALDARTQKPIPGFTREDCVPILEDGVRVPVRWNGGDIGALKAGSIRLRFWLYGAAKVYSFKFT